MLHGPQADESARSAQASLAVDRDGAAVWLSKMVVTNSHKLLDNVVGRRGPINKEQVIVSNVLLDEESLVILFLIESDDSFHIELLENFDVLVRMMTVSLVLVPLLDGAHEGHEFSGNDPVEVTIFDSLILLVFLHIECLEVVPLELDSILESLEALEERALVKAIALGGISVCLEQRVVRFEHLVSLLGRALEDDDHEAAHEECAINHLFRLL